MTENKDLEYWRRAKNLLGPLIQTPSLFSTCLRKMGAARRSLKGRNMELLREAITSEAINLISKSPTLKSVMYLAAKNLAPERFNNISHLSIDQILNCLEPDQLESIICLVYWLRRVRGLTEKSQWDSLWRVAAIHIELSFLIGNSIPTIGGGKAILVGGIRFAGMAILLSRQSKLFERYWNRLNVDKIVFDIEEEEKRFGCSHLHIATLMLQKLGLGVDASFGIVLGLDKRLLEKLDLHEDAIPYAIIGNLTETLHITGSLKRELPGKLGEVDFLPETIQRLRKRAKEIVDNESSFGWLIQGAEVLDEQVREQLGIKLISP